MFFFFFRFYLFSSFMSSGSQAQHSVTQDPTVMASPGQNVRMSCTLGGGLTVSSNRVVFYIQKDGEKPKYILYYFTDSSQGKGEGVSARFTASASGNIGYLSISNVILEDDGVYYCSTWTGSQWHSESREWGTNTNTDTKQDYPLLWVKMCRLLQKECEKYSISY